MKRSLPFPGRSSRLALLFSFLSAAAGPSAADEVIRLPPVLVTEDSGIPWQYISAPGYEVLSRTNATLTREMVQGILEAEQLFKVMVPEDLQAAWSTPRLLILTPNDLAVRASQEFLRGFAPSDEPAPNAGRNRGGTGQVVRPAAGPRIELLDNIKFSDGDILASYAEIDPRQTNHNKVVLSAATAQDMLTARTPALPAWFVSGILELYLTAARDDTTLRFPKVTWISAAESAGLTNDPDYPRTLLPLEEVLTMTPPPPGHPDAVLWSAEAALFVRWALDDRNDMEKQMWKFIRSMAEGVPMERALRDNLAMTPADLRDRLSDYLPVAVRYGIIVRPAKWPRVTAPAARPATAAEVARIKGDLERMEIIDVKRHHPEFADRYIQQASGTLSDKSVADVRDPNFLAVLGLYQVEAGDFTAARGTLQQSVAGKVQRPRAYLELARIRLAEAVKSPSGAGGKLGPGQTTPIFELLLAADALRPPLYDVYSLAVEVSQRSEFTPSPAALALLDAGLKAFPFDLPLLYQTAAVDAAFGRKAAAMTLIDRALRLQQPEAGRARFEALRRVVEAARK